jgi:hypothetical protein
MTTKKSKPPPDDPEESARFVETATALGAGDSTAFARAMKKIVPKRKKKHASQLGRQQ